MKQWYIITYPNPAATSADPLETGVQISPRISKLFSHVSRAREFGRLLVQMGVSQEEITLTYQTEQELPLHDVL